MGSPLYREDLETAGHSEVYWHDAADRLTQFKRGTLNSGKTDVAAYRAGAQVHLRGSKMLRGLPVAVLTRISDDLGRPTGSGRAQR